jgi:UDP-2-acetamido-3-amino-2,3-dideoxy-glucuronate N-acetyltransferase
MKQGIGCVVAADFKYGKNFVMGNYCIIQEGCEVGDNVKMEHFVLLKKGTKIGNNVYVDSYVKSSGDNQIGSGVTLRFNATIAREVTVEDDVFISPNVMTIYSDHKGKAHPGTVIGEGCHVGTNAVIGHGIKIAPGTVIGALSMVTKDIEQPGVYVGIPAVKIKDIK